MNIELGKNINPREIETRIQQFWDSNTFWENDVKSQKPAFCIIDAPAKCYGQSAHGACIG